MSGLTISLITYLLTIIISLLVAVLVKIMVVLLGKFAKATSGGNDQNNFTNKNDSEIAAVIAIAKSKK